jgi:hypothetical protein
MARFISFSILLLLLSLSAFSQRYLADLDSSLFIKDTLRPFLKKFENLQFSGYIQPQFQLADTEGARSFNGGDFSPFSKSRFMLRRARLKVDYLLTTEDKYPKALFTFQVDATERGVNVRDMFIRLYETRGHFLSVTAGLFARPFGFEVNLSSAYRETPERGRMSQTLMPTERDLGAMISYDPIMRDAKNKFFKWDIGLFNGQGLSGTTDFDSHKDLISRITVKPYSFKKWTLSGGLSLLYGGWRQGTQYVYSMSSATNGDKIFSVDSSIRNLGAIAPRHYYGADVQIIYKHAWGQTEWRAEYWTGRQPGTSVSSTNPGVLLLTPIYRREFNGAFFYFLQNIVNPKNQLLVKYDWYDPNRRVSGKEIKANTNLSAADIKYSTLGLGYAYYFNMHVKFIFYYEFVKNESTLLPGYTSDLEDNILTLRLQYRF